MFHVCFFKTSLMISNVTKQMRKFIKKGNLVSNVEFVIYYRHEC